MPRTTIAKEREAILRRAFCVSAALVGSPSVLARLRLSDSYNFTVRLTHSRERYPTGLENSTRARARARAARSSPTSVLHKDQSIKNATLHEINPLDSTESPKRTARSSRAPISTRARRFASPCGASLVRDQRTIQRSARRSVELVTKIAEKSLFIVTSGFEFRRQPEVTSQLQKNNLSD